MNDFAAAQARILARRSAREAEVSAVQARVSQERAERLISLPPSLRVLVQQTLNGWDVVSRPQGTRPAFRVGQVDAELLDEELLNLLKRQAGEGLRLLGAHLKDDWNAEITGALRAILWKLSIWDHAASYGATLQGLRYADARRPAGSGAEATKWQRLAYGLVTVGGRYAWTKWEDHLSGLENGYDEPSSLMRRLSRLTVFLDSTHNIAALLSFLRFLYDGKYRTLTDRILRMRLIPSSHLTKREVSFEFLNRQLVWHAFTEFLLFLLPLVGISRWKRWLARAWKRTKQFASSLKTGRDVDDDETLQPGELGFLPERTCAICYQDQNPATQSEQEVIAAGANTGIIGNASTDITNPYETLECGCIYCFVCLARRIEAEDGAGWTCLRCGELVKECRPWSGDVVVSHDETQRPSSRKSIAWADEIVDNEKTADRGDVPGPDGEPETLGELDPCPVED